MTATYTTETAINFLFLSEPDMIAAGVKDAAQCVDVMEETLVLLAQGDYKMAGLNSNSHGAMITFPENPEFEGMPKDGPDRRFMAMPAYLGGRFKNTGVKWYGSNAENKASGLPRSIHTFVLNDTVTGAPKAIMSANLLSAYRTGAVPGVGVKHLAVADATTLAVVGPGVMAKTITEACIAERPGITTIKIKGRSERGINAFATWALEKFPEIEVVAVGSEEDVVKDADIVIAATTTDAAGSSAFPYFKKNGSSRAHCCCFQPPVASTTLICLTTPASLLTTWGSTKPGQKNTAHRPTNYSAFQEPTGTTWRCKENSTLQRFPRLAISAPASYPDAPTMRKSSSIPSAACQ